MSYRMRLVRWSRIWRPMQATLTIKVRKKQRKRLDWRPGLRIISRMKKKFKLQKKIESYANDTNWTMSDLVYLLESNGFKQSGGRGSHKVYSHDDLDDHITLASHDKNILPAYVKQARNILQLLE
jgi:predicted RNA binding protein YcfA (HicA-like mRNA interferase family)